MIIRSLIDSRVVNYETSFKIGIDKHTITAIHHSSVKLDDAPGGWTYDEVRELVGQEVLFTIIDDKDEPKLNIPCYCESVELMHNTDHLQYYVIELIDLEFHKASKEFKERITHEMTSYEIGV